ncbi:exported hypothetical protein [Vibrio chagasii]|nr:exported hypothetical protein [Vibrio chagasii]
MNKLISLPFLLLALNSNADELNFSNNFEFKIDTSEAAQALEICDGALDMFVYINDDESTDLHINCGGLVQKSSIDKIGIPIFDSISTVNGDLIAIQSVSYMKTFTPSMLRSYYSGLLVDYSNEFLFELSGMSETLSAWDDYL